MPKLSIITINLNNQEGLKKTIQSVVSQSYKDFEYLVIDGGSTDGSVDIIKHYENHIGYWVSEKDKGIYNAMNKGILKAQGEYLLFLNSGDYLYNSDVLKNVFDFNYNHDIVYGDTMLQTITEQGIVEELRKTHKNFQKTNLFSSNLPACHQAMFFKKELFEKHGLYDESFLICADADFFVRCVFKKASIKYIPFIIVYYNRLGISSSPKYQKILNNENKLVTKNQFPFLFYIRYTVRKWYFFFKSKRRYFLSFCRTFFRKFLRTPLRKFLIKIGVLKRHR